MTDLLSETPAQNLEAERAVISAAFMDPLAVDLVAGVITAADFYSGRHATIWRAITELHSEGSPTEPVAVQIRLRAQKQLENVGGVEALTALENCVPTTANAAYYAVLVAEAASLRVARTALVGSVQILHETTTPTRERLARVESTVFAATRPRGNGGAPTAIGDVLQQTLSELDERQRGLRRRGMPTGIAPLDEATGGLQPGEVSILAGRPGSGKSRGAMNFVRHQAVNCNTPTVVVSLEMSATSLAEELLAQMARVDSRHLRDGSLSNDDRLRVGQAADRLGQAPLEIHHGDHTPGTVRGRARRAAATPRGIGLLVVDYIQLLSQDGDGKRRPRHEEVAEQSRALKLLAVELGIPVLACAALNRQSEGRAGYRPRLADLRESGSLEADAALVIMVHSERYSENDPSKRAGMPTGDDTVMIVAKNRVGRPCEVEIGFDRSTGRMGEREALATPAKTADYPRAGGD